MPFPLKKPKPKPVSQGVSPDAIRRWAKGVKHDAMTEDELEAEGDDLDDELELEEGEHNAIWAGEDPRGPDELGMIDEVEAAEFVAWLEEHEPEIAGAAGALVDAVESMDEMAIQAATEQLMGAQQFLNPEYPPLSPEHRQAAAANVRNEVQLGKSREQAIAIGFAKARNVSERPPEEEAEEDGMPERAPAPRTPPPKGGLL